MKETLKRKRFLTKEEIIACNIENCNYFLKVLNENMDFRFKFINELDFIKILNNEQLIEIPEDIFKLIHPVNLISEILFQINQKKKITEIMRKCFIDIEKGVFYPILHYCRIIQKDRHITRFNLITIINGFNNPDLEKLEFMVKIIGKFISNFLKSN